MDDVSSQIVSISVADGTSMDAFVARPALDGKHPCVILFQEAFGINAHIREVAERFAREGYVTIAPELFHRTAPGFVAPYDQFLSTMPHLKALTPEGIKLDARAAFVSGLRLPPTAGRGIVLWRRHRSCAARRDSQPPRHHALLLGRPR